MSQHQQAKLLAASAENIHKLSVSCISSRLQRHWPEDKILQRTVTYRPPMSHPLKRTNYDNVAKRKGWKSHT